MGKRLANEISMRSEARGVHHRYVSMMLVFLLLLSIVTLLSPTIVHGVETYIFSLEWGTTGSGDGEFQWPRGVAVDTDGSVYVTDDGNNRIQEFNSSGGFLGEWGTPGSKD